METVLLNFLRCARQGWLFNYQLLQSSVICRSDHLVVLLAQWKGKKRKHSIPSHFTNEVHIKGLE